MPVQLTVLVVGGGIGGLSAALALRRQGHLVTVLESSAWLREAGAAVAVPPNATRALLQLGVDPRVDAHSALLRNSKEYHFTAGDHSTKFGEGGHGRDIPWAARSKALGYQHLFYMAHRVDLHEAIKTKCLSPDGVGVPVKVELSARVVAWDAAGMVQVQQEGGKTKTMQADLIVAADGIHSMAHEAVLGRKVPAEPSGITTIRFMLKTEDLLNDPLTARIMDDGPGCFTFYVDADRKAYLLRYPCHNDEMQNFGAYAPANKSTLNGERVSRATLISRLSSLPESIRAIATKADGWVWDWKIGDRAPISSYGRDRLVLLGDAAHPMWSRQGQGAAQAIEDAAVLGNLMGSGLNSKDEIPARLGLFDALRVGRTSIVQLLSRTKEVANPIGGKGMAGPLSDEVADMFDRFLPNRKPADYLDLADWIWSYDCVEEVRAALEKRSIADEDAAIPVTGTIPEVLPPEAVAY